MAAAVSNAGGLGTISALTQGTVPKLLAEIAKFRTMSSKPFAVNFTVLPAMMTPDYQSIVQCVIDADVKFVQTAGNGPAGVKFPDGRNMLGMLQDAGIIVIHKCMSIRHALSAERSGVDCISLGGFEYGGHTGDDDVTHWVHAPTAGRKLKVPFLVAGATTVGTQLAAALAMGADGVEIGTGFMATKECPIKQGMKDRIADPKTDERSTILVLRSVKNTGRFYKNMITQEVAKVEAATPGDFSSIAHLMTGKRNYSSFHESGDPDDSAWTMGMGAGMITGIPTCREFMDTMVAEAETVIRNRLQSLVVAKL
jgi:nitronate monooxygenase